MISSVLDHLVHGGFGPLLKEQGFQVMRNRAFTRRFGECQQELRVSFLKTRGQEAGSVQLFVGLLFEDIERIVAEWQGVQVEKGWMTLANNIGNLRTPAQWLEWPISMSTNWTNLGALIAEHIEDYAIPFWNDFATIDDLIKGFEVKDHRLVRTGRHYQWPYAAALAKVRRFDEARSVLVAWAATRPADKELHSALKRIDDHWR